MGRRSAEHQIETKSRINAVNENRKISSKSYKGLCEKKAFLIEEKTDGSIS
jgi:hypothetical protein